MRNPDPYAQTDWEKCERIHTSSHVHCHATAHYSDPEALAVALEKGYELLTFSNYYPSIPYYPLSSVKENCFSRSQKHGIGYNGQYIEGPLEWNKIIAEWKDSLPEEQRRNFPFEEGKAVFPPVPEGILEAPNAEHHSFVDCDRIMERGFHITAPGATWASGHFDVGNRYLLKDHGYHIGAGLPWKEGFRRILDSLLWKDGGGIIINHPAHTRIPLDFLLEVLDYDDRVLGIEVWNTSLSSEGIWDSVLRTGRQCFGFFVPDHFNQLSMMYNPMNILLTQERTARACMKAYRTGSFYGCLFNSGLAFDKITFDGENLVVKTNEKAFIEVIGAPGVLAYSRGNELAYSLSMGKEKIVYLRVKASDGTGETIYSQPMMLSR